MFETEVLPVVQRYARKVLRDEELEAIALVLAWWLWSNRRQEWPPSVYARLAVRRARAGRDLPGVQSSKFRDVWTHLGRAPEADAADRKAGPGRLAEVREEVQILEARLTDAQRRLVELVRDEGLSTKELAERLGLSPGRVSQMRREIHRKSKE